MPVQPDAGERRRGDVARLRIERRTCHSPTESGPSARHRRRRCARKAPLGPRPVVRPEVGDSLVEIGPLLRPGLLGEAKAVVARARSLEGGAVPGRLVAQVTS